MSDPTKKRVRAFTYWPDSKGGKVDDTGGHPKFVTPWFHTREQLFGWLDTHTGFHGGHKIKIEEGSVIRKSRENPSRENDWRIRRIMLPNELVIAIMDWHGGQFTPTYALASTGMRDLVSLSMIDAAESELRGEWRKLKGKQKKDIGKVLHELHGVRVFWREHAEPGRASDFEFDRADYGYTPEEEEEMDVHSG